MKLGDWQDAFRGLGLAVATMSYDGVDVLAEFTADHDIDYPMLSDGPTDAGPAGARAQALGILNEEYPPGHPAHGIAHPGILLIDTQGTIRGKWAEADYRERPRFEDVLADVQALLGAAEGGGRR